LIISAFVQLVSTGLDFIRRSELKEIQTYYQLIPEKVNALLWALEQLIDIQGYDRDNLKEVISLVALHVRKDGEATPLKMTYIKRLVPQGDKYLAALIDLGVIERSGYYVPGQSAYKYSFTPEYDSKYTTTVLNNARLTRRISQAFEQFNREAAKAVRGHSEQVRFLKQLTIDPGFMKFIDENYSTDTEAYNRVLASATRIMNGDIFYTIDKTSGRFHSNVTNCPKGFRPHLLVKGEPLVNIDVKNCQPYLSTIILTHPLKASTFTENPAFAILLQSLKVSHKQDVKNYISLVINGNFYEYLMTAFEAEGLLLDRSETKRQVLRILFARNRSPKNESNRKAREVFKMRFPTVHRIFSKVRGSEKGDRFNSFKRFAILLQRMESYLMLDVVMKRIHRELPNVVAITIHDSIMTGVLTNNVEAVKSILIEELTSFVGFRPRVDIEGLLEKGGEEGIKEERVETESIVRKQYHARALVNARI